MTSDSGLMPDDGITESDMKRYTVMGFYGCSSEKCVHHFAPLLTVMSRNHFYNINNILHLVDNITCAKTGEPGHYPRINLERFSITSLPAMYTPKQCISIDESTIEFKR